MTYRLHTTLRIDPPPDPLHEAGRLYAAQRLAEAAALCRAVIAAVPANAEAHHLLGVTALERGDPDAALRLLERAAALGSPAPRIHYHRGNALLALRRLAEAEACYRAALAAAPSFAPALNNLGNTLRALGREPEAVACYRRVLAVAPDDAPALYNMGLALTRLGQADEAVASLQRALRAPVPQAQAHRLAEVREALIAALADAGRAEEALATAHALLDEQPDNVAARWNASLVLLRLGRYREAWPGYEARWQMPDFRDPLEAGRPTPGVLDLSQIQGKRVLVRGEQGRGDIVQFARYVPLLAARGARVTLTAPFPELLGLLRSLRGLERVIEDSPNDPPHDCDAALLSLPLAFGTELDSVPADTPYLFAPPDREAAWAARLGPRRDMRVALCWRGSAHSRPSSIPLAELTPLLALPGIEWHAVQRDITAEDRALLAARPEVALHANALTDFAETAALLAQMDLVVSIDTVIAHLAGALGRPVWIMLRRSADWRWLTDRADSPWYPSARLFRQDASGSWPPLVARIAEALLDWRDRQRRDAPCPVSISRNSTKARCSNTR